MLRRATGAQLDEALSGLEQALGGGRASWLTCRPMRWWGWGDPHHRAELPPAALAALRAELGAPDRTVAPVALEDVALAEPALETRALGRLRDAVGRGMGAPGQAVTRHARGRQGLSRPGADARRSARERARRGRVPGERRARCGRCSTRARRSASPWSRSVAARAWWAASSRCGGRWAPRSRSTSARIDHARAGRHALADRRAGSRPARARRRARARHDTASRWATSRSRGSTRRSADGSPPVRPARPRPGTAASTSWSPGCAASRRRATSRFAPCRRRPPGPGLRQLLVGSEGVLGVITEATREGAAGARRDPLRGLDVQELRAGRRGVPGAGAGTRDPGRGTPLGRSRDAPVADPLGRGLARPARRAAPTSARAATRTGASRSWASRGRGRTSTCRRARARRILRRGGGLALGASPGRAWLRQRYEGPYLRDALLDHGIMAETLETAAPWSGLLGLYEAVRAAIGGALEARGTPGRVMCHISHLYPDGASLYFTFLARAGGGRRAGAVAQRQSRPPATRSWRPAARSPITTRSAATTCRGCRPRSVSHGDRDAEEPEGAGRPGRDPESRAS